MKRAVIRSTGSYLPERILTNAELEKMVDTSDEWIQQRTGIKERRIAAEDEHASDMAVKAAKAAMENGNLKPEDIDGIIVATTSAERRFPAVAAKVQEELGIPIGLAFDLQAVCTGFVYALGVANSFIQTGQSKRLLVIGAEKVSDVIDWTDRTTCVLFADGAGAIVLEADESSKGTIEDRGVISTHLYANGKLQNILYTEGNALKGGPNHIKMDGREVFKHAVTYLSDIVVEILEHNKITAEDIDWLVPHQANTRIIEGTAKKLGMSMDKVVVTVDRHGNTSAASIPLALDEAVSDGRIKKGDLVLFEALGGGLTWGGALVRF